MRPLLCHLSYAALVIRSASCSDGFYHAYPTVPGIVPVIRRATSRRFAGLTM